MNKEIINNTWGLVTREQMTMRSLAKCVKKVGYPGELDVVYGALLRFANGDAKKKLNCDMLLCVCMVFECEVGDVLEIRQNDKCDKKGHKN